MLTPMKSNYCTKSGDTGNRKYRGSEASFGAKEAFIPASTLILLKSKEMYLPDSSILTNIQVQGHSRLREILFEKKYIVIRSLENRLCTDEELIKLPEMPAEHAHYREWQTRKRSASKLVRYLAGRKKTQEILEVGCGNGWLTHHLAEIPGTKVTGV